jgi:small subunit ribosomal protein S4
LKYIYGILEKQCIKIYKKSSNIKGNTGEILLQICETRLDNIVYRLNLSETRSSARQLILHGHITVNKNKINIPSYSVKIGDLISVKEKYIKCRSLDNFTVKWLNWDKEKYTGNILFIPNREEIPENINEKLIIEWYSR